MKILFFSNTDWFMYNFNRTMLSKLRSNGHDVVLVTPPGMYCKSLRDLGFNLIEAPMQRKSLNPFRELMLLIWLIRLFNSERPHIVHNFTLKCVLLGSLASRFSSVLKCVNELTGLGYVFTSNTYKALFLRKVVLFLFKVSLNKKKNVLILLNQNDFSYFEGFNLLPKKSIHLILGVGVDCSYYIPSDTSQHNQFRVALPARMLWDKGINEFVEASRLLKSQGREIEFWLAGGFDEGNPTSIDQRTLDEWISEGLVKHLGHVKDMRSVYQSVNAIVLPSYREGLPTSLTEGAASGLPLIAANVPGCADVVCSGVNGFLVEVRNAKELAIAIAKLKDDPAMCSRFGVASREVALTKFSKDVIFKKRLDIYDELSSNFQQ